MKKTAFLALALLVFAVALIGCGSANSPEAVVKKYVDAINNNDTVSFIECFPPDIQSEMQSELNEALAGGITMKEGVAHIEPAITVQLTIHGVAADGDSALVDCTVVFGKESERSEVTCVNINGKWYVDMY